MANLISIGKTIYQEPAGQNYPNHSRFTVEVVKTLHGEWPLEERFPRHEDSIPFSNMRYDGFQMVGRYEDKEVKISPAGWCLLCFLEHCGGRASHEEALGNFGKDDNSYALRHGRRAANAALERLLGIPDLIASQHGEIFVA